MYYFITLCFLSIIIHMVVGKGVYIQKQQQPTTTKKVPKIEIIKSKTDKNDNSNFLSSLLFGNNKDKGDSTTNEILDVTMAKYGHNLAFHVIHPEIGDDGSIKPVTGQDDFIVIGDDDALIGEIDHEEDNNGNDNNKEGKHVHIGNTNNNNNNNNIIVNNEIHDNNLNKIDLPLEKKCISWRQTGNCNPNGPREKQKDMPCDAAIHSGASGYCECENNRKVKFSTCEHDSFLCENECTGSHLDIPVDYNDVKNYFAKSTLFEESKPSKINSQLAKKHPFFLFILCNCKNDILIDGNGNPHQNIEDSFPIIEFEKQVRKAKYDKKFTFLYALPAASKAFSLHEQYANKRGTPLDSNKPWLVIDNVPHGAMNEKFLFPGKNIPGMNVNELMDMLNKFLTYKLPLLIRSAPIPEINGEVITSNSIASNGDGNRRRMRGTSSNSHVIDVVSDTFNKIVLDDSRACFLLIYSPNCPASRNVLPILEEVATQHKDLQNVTIAKIDLIHNDLPVRDVIVHHYPTAYLFPAGKNDIATTDQLGNRRMTAYKKPINFANYKGENTPHDINKPHSHWSSYTIAHFIKHEVVPPPSPS